MPFHFHPGVAGGPAAPSRLSPPRTGKAGRRATGIIAFALILLPALAGFALQAAGKTPPNIVLIYADDLGWGDLGCYGATRVKTPNCDRLAAQGLRFTDAHSASAMCSPSRYALLTGEYTIRRRGLFLDLPGNAPLAIEPGRQTLPAVLKQAGLATALVGKWHLGLGAGKEDLNWNEPLRPGPLDIGFDYAFFIPADADRVPCVYVENDRVVGLDPADPLRVYYGKPPPDVPTASAFRKQLKMPYSHGHSQGVVNGLSRSGYQAGGQAAAWKDEDIADTLVQKAVAFIEGQKKSPFFLLLATHDIAVPRVVHSRFAGQSDMGPRGDAIAQFDWAVGEIINALDRHKLLKKTLVILTSDNGPVADDGYRDGAAEKMGDHRPAGPWRGGKYSPFEGGTRVPLLVYWPGRVKAGVSDALICQVDFLASLAALTGQRLGLGAGPDSFNLLPVLLGESKKGRDHLVQQGEVLALREDPWKLVLPGRNVKHPGPDDPPEGFLFRLDLDPGETNNLARQHPEQLEEMLNRLEDLRGMSSVR